MTQKTIFVVCILLMSIMIVIMSCVCYYHNDVSYKQSRTSYERFDDVTADEMEEDRRVPDTHNDTNDSTRPFPTVVDSTMRTMVRMVIFPIPAQIVDIDVPSPSQGCIPKLIHVCWRNAWIPSSLNDMVLMKNRTMVEGFETRFYTNTTIMEFLQLYFPPIVLETYLLINPEYGACMSDFFRYCVLYIFGGMYVDLKTHIRKPLDKLWETYFETCGEKGLVYVSHWPMARYHHIQSVELNHPDGEIMNWVLFASPGHPFFKLVIDEMVRQIQAWHVQKYRYGEKINVLRLTGPIFLTRMVLMARKKDPTIVVNQAVNDYVRYTYTTSSVRIENDRSMYKEAGIPHYSAIVDQIVLYRYFSTSQFIFFFGESSSFSSSSSSSSPPPNGKLSSLEQSLNECTHSSLWVLRPISARDPQKRNEIVRDALKSLDLNPATDLSEEDDPADAWLERFDKLSVQDQNDFIRCAVLYDHGGYFMDPKFSLYSTDFEGDVAWDTYVKQVDVCVMMDKRDSSLSTSVFMKFPAQSPVLKMCMTRLLLADPEKTPAQLSKILTTVVNDTRSAMGYPHRDSSVIPVGNAKYTETWMIASLQPISHELSKTLWTNLPTPSKSPSLVAHFTGQIIGSL